MLARIFSTLAAAACMACAAHAAEIDRHILYRYDIPAERFPQRVEDQIDAFLRETWNRSKTGGFDPFMTYWGDFLANPIGGKSQAASWIQLLVFGGELSLEKNIGWDGASIFISATDVAGSNLSLKVGNIFTISQAYVMNSFALYNLYFKQQLLDDRLEFHIGRMAAGQYFATLPMMGLPVSGAVNGNPTSLFLNAPFTSTASAVWSAYGKFQPTDEFYIDAGVFQASPRAGNPAYHGIDFSIRPGDGLLVISEAGWTPTFGATGDAPLAGKEPALSVGADVRRPPPHNPGLPGVYTFGGYYSNYTFDEFSGGVEHNAYGIYWLAQQMIWRSPLNANNSITLWGGITYSPQEEIAQMPVMGFGGVGWQGCIPGRDKDSLQFAFYTGGLSDAYADAQAADGAGRPTVETVLELSYIVQLTSNFQFQPDLQWVIQPGGHSSIPNALVLGFQFAASF